MQHIDRLTTPTKAEKQVLYYLREGWSFAEIAKHRGCSVRTIESHVHNLYQKAGLFYGNRVSLIDWGSKHGYCEPMKPVAIQLSEARRARAAREARKRQLLEQLEKGIDRAHSQLKEEFDLQLSMSKHSILKEANRIIDECLRQD